MIRKPEGQEQESNAHRAVGRAMEIGGEVRSATRKGARVARGCYLAAFLTMMMFGLLVSATPWWFKGLGVVLFALGIRYVRSR